jgi:hypothetical protein
MVTRNPMPTCQPPPAETPRPRSAKPRKRKLQPARSNGRHPGGRPTAYSTELGQEICAIIAEGNSFAKALAQLGIQERTGYRWASAHTDFRQDLMRARGIRGDFTFGEQILDIADDTSEDWLRSRVRIAARQVHMARLQPQTWGDKQSVEIKDDWTLLSEEERRRRAEELILMIQEIKAPPEQPPPLALEEVPEEAEPGSWQPRSATGR